MILYSKELLYKKTWQQGVSSVEKLTFIHSYSKSESVLVYSFIQQNMSHIVFIRRCITHVRPMNRNYDNPCTKTTVSKSWRQVNPQL